MVTVVVEKPGSSRSSQLTNNDSCGLVQILSFFSPLDSCALSFTKAGKVQRRMWRKYYVLAFAFIEKQLPLG